MQALININVTRPTTNINAPLPFVLFNVVDFSSGYAQSTKGIIPPNTERIFSGVEGINTGNVRFRYRNTITNQYDNITVSCNEIPYVTLMHNTYNNKMIIKNVIYAIDDPNLEFYQYGQRIDSIKSDFFGKKIVDSITPAMYKNDLIKLQDSIDIPLNYEITSSNGLINYMTDKSAVNVSMSLIIEY